MAEINVIKGIVKGQYGVAIPLTIVDDFGTAVDISAYTGIAINIADEFRTKNLSFTGAFITNGTNGQIQFTPTAVNTFDRAGKWVGQVKLTATGIVTRTVLFDIEVEESLSA